MAHEPSNETTVVLQRSPMRPGAGENQGLWQLMPVLTMESSAPATGLLFFYVKLRSGPFDYSRHETFT